MESLFSNQSYIFSINGSFMYLRVNDVMGDSYIFTGFVFSTFFRMEILSLENS